jgi:hypothetical protein
VDEDDDAEEERDRPPEDLRADAFFADALRPEDFFADDFFADDLRAEDFFAEDFFADDLRAEDFFAEDLRAPPFDADLRLEAFFAPPFDEDLRADDFFAPPARFAEPFDALFAAILDSPFAGEVPAAPRWARGRGAGGAWRRTCCAPRVRPAARRRAN